MVTPELVKAVLASYGLPRWGTHGISHWARVYENGLRLAALMGADATVVRLFALFHDAGRRNEVADLGHGRRGFAVARRLLPEAALSAQQWAWLQQACEEHTDGLVAGPLPVRVCWDADRLDLLRCDITPDPRYLCTSAAMRSEVLAWANARARARAVPALVQAEWGVEVGG